MVAGRTSSAVVMTISQHTKLNVAPECHAGRRVYRTSSRWGLTAGVPDELPLPNLFQCKSIQVRAAHPPVPVRRVRPVGSILYTTAG